MDIKLPINPRVREAIEKELAHGTPIIVKDALGGGNSHQDTRLPLVDGLYQEAPAFPQWGPVGADFILNFERFSAGLLSEDQADKFLRNTLLLLPVAHMRVIHPQLDTEGMIMHMVRERFEKTSNQELKDLCIRKRDFDPGHPSASGFFEVLKKVLVKQCTETAPMAIALGQPKDLVLKQLVNFIDQSLNALDITDDRWPHIRTGFLHHFLIAYPDLWNQTNTEAYHFLGELMIHMMPGRGMSADKAVVERHAGKSMIRQPGNAIPRGLMKFTLDYLVAIDPDVLDARHLLREGTRSDVWLDRCSNLEQGLPILERLLAHGVVHPAIERIDGLVSRLTEAGKYSALVCYADGGAIPEEVAMAIIEASPGSYDNAFKKAEEFPALQRLAKLKWPSDEQFTKLSPINKRRLLEGDLGI